MMWICSVYIRKRMKGVVVVALFLLVFTTGCERAGEKKETGEDRVIAKIGEKVITEKDFEAMLHRTVPERERITPPELKELKRNLLNQLIEEELILMEAQRRGIMVTDQEVEKEVKNFLEEGDESVEAVIKERYGSLDEWKKEIERRLLIKKTIHQVIEMTITVTDKEAREYYNKNRKAYEIPQQVRARMIVVPTEEEARKIKGLLKKRSFEEIAKEYSIGPEAEKGGDLGFFGKGDMPPEFEVVFKLPKGAVSRIVKTPYGYHIFKVVEKKKGRKLRFQDVKGLITEKIRRERVEKKYHEWILTLKKNIEIDVDRTFLAS